MRRIWGTAVLLTALATTACGGAPAHSTPAAPSSPAAFEVDGVLTLKPGQFLADNGTSCEGKDGYDDLALGAQVSVTDAAGAVVALGKIDAMSYTDDPGGDGLGGTCDLKFSIPGVPAGKSFYGVEVSHRGAVKFEEANLKAGPVQLTVG
jgi:hypothetical protein